MAKFGHVPPELFSAREPSSIYTGKRQLVAFDKSDFVTSRAGAPHIPDASATVPF
jgi:hypothetical protein